MIMKKPKFKVGDKVCVKPLSWYVNYEKKILGSIDCDGLYFTREMSRLCGLEAIVSRVIKGKYELSFNIECSDKYFFNDKMLDSVNYLGLRDGDTIRVKSIDWYNENKDDEGDVWFGRNCPFQSSSSFMCGEEYKISGVDYFDESVYVSSVGTWIPFASFDLIDVNIVEPLSGTMVNPDDKTVNGIKKGLIRCKGLCPCVKSDSDIPKNELCCPCKEYRDTLTCRCNLYIPEIEEDDNFDSSLSDSLQEQHTQLEPECEPSTDKQNKSILEIASEIRKGSRESDYGDAVSNFDCISNFTKLLWGDRPVEITPELCAIVQIAVKFSRERFKHKEDNLVDACGYIDILNEIKKSKQ